MVLYKVWVETECGRVFGEGLYRLLKGIELTGSLREAALGLGMAYSKAHRILSSCERNIGFPLITREIGGATGGGSKVTAAGFRIMKEYKLFRRSVEKDIEKAWLKHFGQSIDVKLCESTPRKRQKKVP